MDKRARVVMLPSNEKADLQKFGRSLRHKFDHVNSMVGIYQHLYFILDDTIKEGDWFIVELFKIDGTSDGLHVERADYIEDVWINKGVTIRRHSGNCKKIIATTDSSLTISGYDTSDESADVERYLPKPSQSFILKFVDEYNKGNKIEDVMVEYETDLPITCTSEGVRLYPNLKVSKDNTITIRRVKNRWSRDEVVEILNNWITLPPKCKNLDKWIKDNL